MAIEEREALGFSIGPIGSDDDAGETYAIMKAEVDRKQLGDFMNGLAPPAPATAPAQSPAPASQPASAPSSGNPPSGDEGGSAASPEKNWAQQILEGAQAVGSDVGRGAIEAPGQVVGGVIDAFGEVDQMLGELMPNQPALQVFAPDGSFSPAFISQEQFTADKAQYENDLFSVLAPDDADTVTGGFVRSTAQFLTGFIPAFKAVKGVQMFQKGTVAASAVAGVLADMAVFDPHEDRLSTFLNEVPGLGALVPDYLADNDPEHESAWEGRMKNAVEGLGLGLATDGLLKLFKYYKAQRRATAGKPEAVLDAQQVAARDALLDASKADIVADVPDEALRPLGNPDPNAPLLITGTADETAAVAFTRVADAEARLQQSTVTTEALSKISEILNAPRQSQAVPGVSPINPGEGVNVFDQALTDLRGGVAQRQSIPKRPIATLLKEMGGIDPSSPIGLELKGMGITSKTMPGLFRKGGAQALDNIPRAEVERMRMVAGDGSLGDYIPEQEWMTALSDELAGNPRLLPEEQAILDNLITPAAELDEQLQRVGININEMSNSQIVAKLQQIEEEEALFRRSLEEVPPTAKPQDAADLDDFVAGADRPGAGALEVVNGQAKTKVFINHARIQSSDDVKAVIQQMADQDAEAIAAKTRGVVSNSQTIKESSQEYRDLSDLIGREPGPMTAAQAVAARRLLASSGEQIIDLAKRAQAPDASKADLFNFRRAMAVHYALQSEVIAARTETARALQSWSIPVGASKARADAISELITQAGGAGDIQQIAKAVTNVADNPAGIGTIARELGKSRLGKAAFQVWINGLLSSPKTHMVNILSNAMVSAYAIPERYMSAAISKVFYGGEIEFGEVAAQAYGMIKGMRDGARLVYQGNKAEGTADLGEIFDAFVKTDAAPVNAISAEALGLDPRGSIGWGMDLLGKVVNVPSTMLAAEDKFFKSIGYRMELNALAFRTASGEGLEGAAFAKRVADILNDPPATLKADAINAAHYQTFTKPLGQVGQAVQLLLTRAPIMRIVVPFVRTPTNIMKYTLERTPLAYMSGKIRSDIRAGGTRAAQAHARVALGSMIMLTMADMAMEGTITGAGPLDPKVRASLQATGWQPYSVKIGDRYYQYKRLDPIGMLVGLAADTAEILANAEEEEGGRLVGAGVIALANNLASKTYMSGIYDFIGAIDPSNPTTDPMKYLADMTTSIVPYSSFLRNIAGAVDPTMRDARDGGDDAVGAYLDTMVNNIKKGIPGMSDTLPPRRDLWGEEISTASGIGWAYDLLSPIASRVDNPDPIDTVIVENNIVISMPPRIIQGAKLSNEEYSQFVQLAGEPAKAYLDQLVASPSFQRMSDGPDGMKAEVIKDVINTHRRRATLMMMATMPELRERVFRTKKERVNALTGQ